MGKVAGTVVHTISLTRARKHLIGIYHVLPMWAELQADVFSGTQLSCEPIVSPTTGEAEAGAGSFWCLQLVESFWCCDLG